MIQPSTNITKKKNLDEISFIRPILILMLVMYHAFAPWVGAWNEPEGFVANEYYWWWGKLNYSFMLETFVMISGYLFGNQLSRNRISSLRQLIRDKVKRLLLPCAIFSTLYIIVFNDVTTILNTIYNLFNGAGHMWFLPMLFWCFIGTYILHKLKLKESLKIAGLFVLALISFVPLPLQLDISMYYMIYFYVGTILCRNRDKLRLKCNSKKVVLAWLLFIVLFISLTQLRESLKVIDPTDIITRILRQNGFVVTRILYASTGSFALYLTSLLHTKTHSIPLWVVNVGSLCFGVYIFHQFILKYIYYKTPLAENLSAIWLPWVGFAIALCLSLLFCHLTLKTKVGKYLIG